MKPSGTGGRWPPKLPKTRQGQAGDRNPKGNEYSSSVEDYSFTSKPSSTGESSVSSFSSNPSRVHQRRRFSVASADVARLITSFSKGSHVISYDTCTGLTSDRTIRDRLNETIYELMLARAAGLENISGAEGLRRSTEETPFVEASLTGDEAVDAFILERTARAEGGPGPGNDPDEYYGGDEEGNEKSSWQSSSAWRRGLVVLLLALLFVALSHIASFIFLLQSTEVFEHPYACKTKNCLQLSEWLLGGLDNKTHPCDDFHQFTCGGYMRDHPMDPMIDIKGFRKMSEAIPFEYISNQGLGRLLHRVHEYPLDQILPFYQACIDQDERDRIGFNPFFNLLLQLKLMDPVKAHPMDIARTIVRIYRKVNRRIFFDTYGSKENFIVVNLCQPDKEITQFNPNEYVTSMRKAFMLLRNELNIAESEIETIVYLVIRFEAEVVFIQSKETLQVFGFPDNMAEFVRKPPAFHPNYIPSQMGFFRFDSYVAELFEHQRNFQNVSMFFNYLLSISKQEERLYVLFMEELLSRTPSYVLLRYFQWILIKHFAVDLTTELLEIMIPIFRAMGPTPDERCFRSMFSKLHVLAATRYSRELKNLPYLDKKVYEVAELVTKIWTTLKDLTEGFPTGMIDSFKETFSTFTIVQTAIADFEPYIRTFYNGLEMSMDTHFENVVQATTLKAKNDLKKLQNIPPFHLWPLGEYSVDEVSITRMQNARETSRFLYIPLGALQQPYMGNDLPLIDIGGFGFWIGAYYMMRYTIDDLLVILAKERETEEPETSVIPQKQMEMELLPRLECIFDQFRRTMSFHGLDVQTDPTSEKGRVYNLAFFTAVELLLETMARHPNDTLGGPKNQVLLGLESYTPEQLFFMAMTRHLCKDYSRERRRQMSKRGLLTPAYHINTVFRNSPHFSQVWGCSARRFMNPPRKCKFFIQKSNQTNSTEPWGRGYRNSTN